MSDLRRYNCRACQAMTSGFRLAGGPIRCEHCLTPFGNVNTSPPKKKKEKACTTCSSRSGWFESPKLGLICIICATPKSHSEKEGARRRTGDSGIGRRRDRKLAREEAALETGDMLASHPGNPLGHGMPIGTSLRYEEESHREAWKRVLRGDVCAYCWQPTFPCAYTPEGGTVDHIDPQSGPRPMYGLHTWMNYTGACASCNRSKGAQKLLLWLAGRAISAPRVRDQ